jgi:hypothetical protein
MMEVNEILDHINDEIYKLGDLIDELIADIDPTSDPHDVDVSDDVIVQRAKAQRAMLRLLKHRITGRA